MQVDALAVQLRPRTMAEAADLGAALVRTHARSVWRCYAVAMAMVLVLALATSELSPWAPTLVVFLAKPWLDRTLLFVLSRAVFGQETRPRDLWAQRKAVLGSQLAMLPVQRLSPWRSYTQPALQLEGQQGKARRKRRDQLLAGRRGAAFWMQFAFSATEGALITGAYAALLWFAPEGTHAGVLSWLAATESFANVFVSVSIYAGVIFALEPFFVAAGFAMYLNRRVELEAWDVEQEFRRAFAR
ncbi:hypothetical protein [Caenimonas sp. SL110]|uniref:hypothetical protein n=1 Tax=Caenimonas sp. SL110 TaxID=1450524 RepID=UPI0006543863|nr:hypothetical protein [Caenimonas sp. SL110]